MTDAKMLALLLAVLLSIAPLDAAPRNSFLEQFELPGVARLRSMRGDETPAEYPRSRPLTVVGKPSGEAPWQKPECTIRVVPADPLIDQGILRNIDPPVDAAMAGPSRCTARGVE